MNETPTIKYTFFDLDNLLYPSSEIIERQEFEVAAALKNAAPKHSRLRNASIDEIAQVYAQARQKLGSNAPHFPFICEHFGIDETPELRSSGRVAYHRSKFGLLLPYPNVEETILSLIKRDLGCGIITDGPEDKQWDKIHTLGLYHFFSPVIISEAVSKKYGESMEQVSKPNRRIYDEAIETVNTDQDPHSPLQPNEVIYLDDRLTGVLGANLIGMHTVLIPHGKYKGETADEVANTFGVNIELVKADFTLHDISELETEVFQHFRIEKL